MSWFLRPERWPITPGDWLRAADDLVRSPTRVLIDLFDAVTGPMVGKELELRSADGAVRLHLEAVAAAHSSPPVAMGALRPGFDLEGLESVEVTARDVELEHGRIDRLTVDARDVHLEGGLVTHLVAGPIALEGELDQTTLDEWLADHGAPVSVELDGTDRATVRRSRWVRGEVSADLDGDEVTVSVHRIRVAGIPVPFGSRWVKPQAFTIPPLPRDLRVTRVTSEPGILRIRASVDRFEEPLQLERVLRAAQTVGSRVVLDRIG